MAETFDAAIYTNCAAGQGLDGIAGMQFQSRTPGMSRELLAIVKRHLLYEPPETLMRHHRPVAEFPPSFAHVLDDNVLATASGRYKGREAVGSREGNHLTHAVVTRDRTTYGSARPAQLAGAEFWASDPRPTTDAEPPPADWQPGPIGPAAASDFVTKQPDGPAMLAALVSILADRELAGRRRVVIRTHDAGAALHWLVAATVLLPQKRALEIGFKVFSMDPARSALPVVAVHPQWSAFTGTVEHDRGYALFDLERRQWTAVHVDPEARAWAELFCTTDPDAVVEAVDLAAASGLHGATARVLSTTATLGGVPDASTAPQLLRWLRGGPPAVRETYGALVINALAGLPHLELLNELEDIVRLPDYASQGDVVRIGLLKAELAAAATEPDRVLKGTARHQAISDDALPQARQLVAAALRSRRGRAFAATLTTAAAHGVPVHLGDADDAVTAFVGSWLDEPNAPYTPTRWTTEPPIRDRLAQEIERRVQNSPAAATVLATTWWRLLRPDPFVADLGATLDAALLSAAMASTDERHRGALVERNLAAAAGEYRRTREARRVHDATAALWRRSEPTTHELQILVNLLPGGVAPDPKLLARCAMRVLHSEPVSLPELSRCAELISKGVFAIDSSDAVVADVEQLAAANDEVVKALRHRFDARHPSRGWLQKLPPPLVHAHADTFVERIRAVEDPLALDSLLATVASRIVDQYVMRCAADTHVLWSPRRAAVIFYLLRRYPPRSLPAADTLQASLGPQLRTWVRTHDAHELHTVLTCLQPLGPGWTTAWREAADELSAPRGALSAFIHRLRDRKQI